MSTPFRLRLPRRLFDEMVAHAQAELPNECCGLFAGTPDGRVMCRYPLVNTSASAREYTADGRDRFEADKDMRQQRSHLLAIYHSHPTSAPVPSRTDLERNAYGTSAVHLIVSLLEAGPQVRGWWLGETDYREADWDIL